MSPVSFVFCSLCSIIRQGGSFGILIELQSLKENVIEKKIKYVPKKLSIQKILPQNFNFTLNCMVPHKREAILPYLLHKAGIVLRTHDIPPPSCLPVNLTQCSQARSHCNKNELEITWKVLEIWSTLYSLKINLTLEGDWHTVKALTTSVWQTYNLAENVQLYPI